MRRGAAGAAAVLAAWPLVEPHLPVLRRAEVAVLPVPGRLRVLHVSDLHLLPRHRRRAAWVRDLARLRADLVVSTGDHWSSADAGPLLVETLGALTAGGAPGVLVPGNNDLHSPVLPRPWGYLTGGGPRRVRTPDLPWDDVARDLVAAGWTDLTHRRVAVDVAGVPLVLTGTDDAHLRRDRYARVAGLVAAGALGVGVTHTPQRALLDAFARDGHRLLLAGHTHGGQLRLPGLGAVVTNCDLPRPQARGLSRWGHGPAAPWLHVSAGLGTSPYVPVRLCCRPEATLLDLLPAPGVR